MSKTGHVDEIYEDGGLGIESGVELLHVHLLYITLLASSIVVIEETLYNRNHKHVHRHAYCAYYNKTSTAATQHECIPVS